MGATLDGLTGALFCRLDIGQGKNPQRMSNEPCILLNRTNSVNFVLVGAAGTAWLLADLGALMTCFSGLYL
jgi:hypothetical protein